LRYFISQEHLTGVLSFGATKRTHLQPQEVSSLVLQIELTCNHNKVSSLVLQIELTCNHNKVSSLVLQIELTCNHNKVSSSVLPKELTWNHRNLNRKHKMENTNFKHQTAALVTPMCA
jgi:hypothetical protein